MWAQYAVLAILHVNICIPQQIQNGASKRILKIGYSRICACTKIPVFCLPPGPADENKGSRPSLIALQTELLLLYLNGV